MKTAKPFALDPNARGAPNNRWDSLTLLERFWSHVGKRRDGCWLWSASTNAKGYGTFGYEPKRNALAHRCAWALARGPIPPGMLVLHSRECVSRACVRPDHLRLGTQKENVADTMALGRALCQRGPPPWVVELRRKKAQAEAREVAPHV